MYTAFVTFLSLHCPRHTHSFIFFIHCYAAPRYLPSFPTRRSSDLWKIGVSPSESRIQIAIATRRREMMNGTRQPQSLKASTPDRKSTRLNSSHTVISYAVFCLKKKKKKQKHKNKYHIE